MLINELLVIVADVTAPYWTAQAYGGSVQPTNINQIDGLADAAIVTKSREILGFYGQIGPVTNLSRPTTNMSLRLSEGATLVVKDFTGADLEAQLVTVLRLITKYEPLAYLDSVVLKSVESGQMHIAYLYYRRKWVIAVV